MFITISILRVYYLETHCDSSASVILRVSVTAVAAAARSGLIWLGVHGVVVGWLFGSVGCHATIKGAE